MTDLAIPDRVLAVGAHPDDVELQCGGTLAKWAAAGTEITICALTDGSKGTWDPGADLEDLVEGRYQEQLAAAAALGGATVWRRLGFVDGELTGDRREQEAVCEVIRAVRPDIVLGHDPWKRYRLHPDHQLAGQVTIAAVVAARDPHFFPGRGTPHRPRSLLLFEAEVVDHVEDVTTTLETKVTALLCHESQWQSTFGIDPHAPDPVAARAAFAERLRAEAAAAGAPAGIALGEGFKLIQPL